MSKLAIITVHKGSILNLEKTIKSVLSQIEKPKKFLIITPHIQNLFVKKYKKIKFIKFIVGRDKSIYNAMNIGLNLTKKNSILFLNSGDIFFDKNCTKIASKYLKKKSKFISIFKVVLRHNKSLFFPKKKYFLSKSYLPHPGFIRPPIINNNSFIKYIENFETISDGIWMLSNTKIFKQQKISKNFVIHELGGVSTVPTFKLMNEKFRLSKSHFIKETLKFLLYKAIGQTLYYRLIYFNKFNFNESKKK